LTGVIDLAAEGTRTGDLGRATADRDAAATARLITARLGAHVPCHPDQRISSPLISQEELSALAAQASVLKSGWEQI